MLVEVSIGELVDKVSILAIKIEKFKNAEKKINVENEYRELLPKMNESGIELNSEEYQALKDVNLKLWDIEDKLRVKESQNSFDKEFIELARSVYFTNDERSRLKKVINLKTGAELIEEKEYVKY
jgi:hypothetical protein